MSGDRLGRPLPPQATHTVYKGGGDVKEKPEDLLRPSKASAVSIAAAISRVIAPPSGRLAPPRRRRFPRRERPPGPSSPFHGSAGVRATARTVRRWPSCPPSCPGRDPPPTR